MEQSRRFLLTAGVVAALASVGTLVLSEVLGLVPCELCWYQRLLLYPQIFIIGVAVLVPVFRLAILSIPLSVAGVGVATYHSWLQLQPSPSDTCSLSNPCSEVTFEVAGLSIPNLSLLTFLALVVLLAGAFWFRYRSPTG